MLTGKYKPGQDAPAGSRATDAKGGSDMISRWMKDDVLSRVQQLQPIADEAGLSMAQLAVAWVLQNPNVSAAIIGASRPEQVTENVKAAGVRIEDSAMKQIDEILDGVIERDASKTVSPSAATSAEPGSAPYDGRRRRPSRAGARLLSRVRPLAQATMLCGSITYFFAAPLSNSR